MTEYPSKEKTISAAAPETLSKPVEPTATAYNNAIDLKLGTGTFTKESTFLGISLKEKSEEEKRLVRFKEFLNTHWGLPAVVVLFRGLFAEGYPPIPIPNRWCIPKDIDVTQLTWEQLQTESFIDEIWPSIIMLLGDDITNFEWAARVTTVLSLFNIIKVIPVVLGGSK